MDDNSYNIVILIIFTTVLTLYVNYDIKLFNKMEQFQNELSNIDTNDIPLTENLTTPNNYILDQRLDKLKHFMNKFHKLIIPINVDDNGILCNNWANDPKERNSNLNNNYCQLNGKQAYCLNNKNDIMTCNKLYNKEIQRMATIDTDSLINSEINKLKFELDRMNKDIERKRIDLDDTLERLVSKKNIINQQKFFVKQNSNRLSESKNVRDKINDDLHHVVNEYEISKFHAGEAKKDINDLHNRNNTLNNIIMGLSILLIIVVIIGLLLTRIN
mgnify:FL=1